MNNSASPDYHIRAFRQSDQYHVRTLILHGLAQRFGEIDESANPDIDDIHSNYVQCGDIFVVAQSANSEIIGCGALIREHGSNEIVRIVRVSVMEAYQRHGIGRAISQKLIELARENGFQQILVETNDDWHSALKLYQSLGFIETHRAKNPNYDFIEVHMALTL